MTIDEYKAAKAKSTKPRKFGNEFHEVDGIRFDSGREAKRYGELKLMQKAGIVAKIELQIKYNLVVNSKKICAYIADFKVTYPDGRVEIEDTKGFKTRAYQIKKKLMQAIHGITIKEI